MACFQEAQTLKSKAAENFVFGRAVKERSDGSGTGTYPPLAYWELGRAHLFAVVSRYRRKSAAIEASGSTISRSSTKVCDEHISERTARAADEAGCSERLIIWCLRG
jgi:hypothetical protein